MHNRRSKLFWLSTVIMASTAMVSCTEEDFVPQQNTNKPIIDNITPNDMSGADVMKKLDPKCYNSETCMTDPDCTGDLAYIACKCVVDKACSTNPQCNGIVDSSTKSNYTWCNYTCGKTVKVGLNEVDTCNWTVCASNSTCVEKNQSGCNPATIGSEDPTGDYDKDGVSNRVEANSPLYNPCEADSDKDGVVDGLEDLNGDGKIDELLGETYPNDPTSVPDLEGGEGVVREAACDAKEMRGHFVTFNETAVAQFGSDSSQYKYVPSPGDTKKEYVILNDSGTNVYGFFFRDEISYEGKVLIKKVVSNYLSDKVTEYFEELNQKGRVPEDSWLDSGYNKNSLQRVPSHTVHRLKYALKQSGGLTPSAVRDAIAKTLTETPGNVTDSDSKACTGDVRVYLARSIYEDSTIYSFAVACAEDVGSNGDGFNQMEDILSGTMVASNSYKPFEDFMCQTKLYGDASGAVDFIWVVDNSGSMIDEQSAVSQTVEMFTERLNSSGINYRLGVTTTDAYTLDEADEGNGYNLEWPATEQSDYAYPIFRETGLRPYLKAMNVYGFLDTGTRPTTLRQSFQAAVTDDANCDTKNAAGKNICGYGIEDGLKSLETVLDRLTNPSLSMIRSMLEFSKWPTASETSAAGACKVSEDEAPNCYAADPTAAGVGKLCYDELKRNYEKRIDSNKAVSTCLNRLTSITLRDEALKYIIWISDENSRQFKEKVSVVKDPGQPRKMEDIQRPLFVCRTGYELLDNGSLDITNPNGILNMIYGPCQINTNGNANCTDTAEQKCVCEAGACNPTMPENKRNADNDNKLDINETTQLSDISTLADGAYKPQYEMLMYYMTSYLKYAGKGGIAGFALVGDDFGSDGSCKELIEGKTDGADYGYDYILTARYLSTFQKYSDTDTYINADGNYNMSGQEGGFASICNTNYSEIVNNIMTDAIGRVASHNLKGYPISSTIRVALVNPGDEEATLLERGAATNGWQYNSAQNSITLSGVTASSDAYLAISYVLWKVNEG